jgi:peptidoglycan/LPS O-acetylase OafA/YrhL
MYRQPYRPEIDGLRAIAVVAVVLFHLDVPFVYGGLLGVDIFFVISGYLITKILLDAIDANTFSIAGFYERRARRILPALMVVLLFTSLAAYFILNNYDYKNYNKSLSALSLFGSNFFFWKTTNGYFAANAQQMPLLHTWSLSVEEQFYVLYPAFVFGARKFFGYRYFKIILLFLFAVSLAGFCISGLRDGNEAFYNSFYRCWELLAGGLLSAGILPQAKKRAVSLLVPWVGAILVLCAIYYFGSIPYNFVFSILSVAGTFCILYASQDPGNFITRILSARPVVFIGKCSYSLYLWHWPLIVFAGLVTLNDLSVLQKTMIIAVSFLLSVLSYKYVEQPFRRKNGLLKSRKKILIAAVVLLMVTGLSGFALYKYKDLTHRSAADMLLADADNDRLWIDMVKNQNRFESDTARAPAIALGNEKNNASFIVWGDSHAHVLAYGMDWVNKPAGRSGYLLSFPGTPPLLGVEYEPKRKPSDLSVNSRIFDFISQHPEIKTIVLDARWMAYFLRRNKYARIEDPRATAYDSLDAATTSGLPSKKIFKSAMRFTLNELHKLNRKVIIVTPIPETPYTFNKLIIHARFYNTDLNDLGASTAEFDKHISELNIFFNSLASPDVKILPADRYFRNGNRFLIQRNNHLLYRDRDHLSRYGAVEVARGVEGVFE